MADIAVVFDIGGLPAMYDLELAELIEWRERARVRSGAE